VGPAIGTTGKPPDLPGIDVAEDRLASLGGGAHTIDIFQDPFNLRTREVGRQGQTHLGSEAILSAILAQHVTDILRARILPDDGIEIRLTGLGIPHDGGLALVGDTHRGNITGLGAYLLHRCLDHVLCASPNLHRIMFDPTGLGVDLLVLHLVNADHPTTVIENHTSGTGRTLINCCCILSHFITSVWKN
jgi:hypothetical protein